VARVREGTFRSSVYILDYDGCDADTSAIETRKSRTPLGRAAEMSAKSDYFFAATGPEPPHFSQFLPSLAAVVQQPWVHAAPSFSALAQQPACLDSPANAKLVTNKEATMSDPRILEVFIGVFWGFAADVDQRLVELQVPVCMSASTDRHHCCSVTEPETSAFRSPVRRNWCGRRESNPRSMLGKHM
jgi:hypothetical protein